MAVATVYNAIVGIIFANGIPEAIVAAVLVTAVGKVLLKVQKRTEDSMASLGSTKVM